MPPAPAEWQRGVDINMHERRWRAGRRHYDISTRNWTYWNNPNRWRRFVHIPCFKRGAKQHLSMKWIQCQGSRNTGGDSHSIIAREWWSTKGWRPINAIYPEPWRLDCDIGTTLEVDAFPKFSYVKGSPQLHMQRNTCRHEFIVTHALQFTLMPYPYTLCVGVPPLTQ